MSYKNILHEKTLKWSLTLFPLNQVPKISVTSPKHQSVGEGKLERKNNSLWVVIFKKKLLFQILPKMISKYIGRLPPKAMEETYAREISETELDNSLSTRVSRQEMCMWERKGFGAFLYWFLSALRDGFQGCLCPSLISLLLDGPSFYISSFLWRERLGTYYSGYRLAVAVVLHLRTQVQ